MKPLGIKWPQDPIKALGNFFSYTCNEKLLFLKNFTEKLDEINTLINIWIGPLEGGGIKMIDIEKMIKFLRLA